MIMGWLAKVKRRKGGVYVVRVDHHRFRALRVTGYAGESVHFHFRWQDHLGKGRYGHAAQPWTDLNPKFYRVIPLPWWLCWKWILRSLETLVILATWPVYNDAKNRWNPRRIPKPRALAQRAARDSGTFRMLPAIMARLARAGVLLFVLGGLALWLVNR